jgi:hypothetical protein
MDAEQHPDLFQDAAQHGLQRAVQVASCAVTAGQVYIYHQKATARIASERDERARRALNAQIRADREVARAGWAPALDPQWPGQADLPQTARAWSAAMPYADRAVPWYEPAAATAMRKCEDRLRDLHPYAMSRYDRLRADRMSPAEAMREAAPLFARPSRVYDTPYTSRPALDAGDSTGLSWTGDAVVDDSSVTQSGIEPGAQALERRGRQILGTLQTRAREHGRHPLGEAEQRIVLEAVTSLPAGIIDQIVAPGPAGPVDTASGRGARAIRPWEHDFPMPIRAVVTATATSPAASMTAADSPIARQPEHRAAAQP